MKTTLIVLFLLAALVSSTQTFRHVYVKWLQPRTSVLDEFKDDIETTIDEAKDLDELTALYRDAYQKVKKYEADPGSPKISSRERINTEPYKSEQKIKREIITRENDHKQLFKLVFYWSCGLISLFMGLVSFVKVNRWLGLAGIIIGFSEMLCWTSPLFHNRYEHLLNYKLIFSGITWVILISLWLMIQKKGFLFGYEVSEES